MATRQLPDAELLRKLLRYDPETGKLYWRERTPDMFRPGVLGQQHMCQQWNSKFADREAFTAVSNGYLIGRLGGANYRSHRVIWCMVYGEWPNKIDHINQNRADNRLENLQLTSHEENGRNCRLGVRNRSGRIGVNWSNHHNRWEAKIRANGRYIKLGRFDKFEDACAARSLAEKVHGYSPRHGSAPEVTRNPKR